MLEEGLITNIIYYSDKNCNVGEIKNCTIRTEFMFCRTDFVLVSKKLNYYVCVFKEGELLSVWSCPLKDTTKSKAMSNFRNGFYKNKVTAEMIDLFKNKPKTFKRRFVKSKQKV